MNIKTFTYLLYIVSNLLLLFNPGIFWDDWTLYENTPEGIFLQATSAGSGYLAHLHVFLQELPNPPLFVHGLVFVLQLLSIFLLFRIVSMCSYFKGPNAAMGNFLVLIYAVLPLMDAKIPIICFPYILTLTFFIFATYLLLKYKQNRNFSLRILSLLFFFVSFTTASLVFFYIVPFLFIILGNELKKMFNKGSGNYLSIISLMLKKVIKYPIFLLLPIIFWVIKNIYFSASAHYEASGYNEIKMESLFEIPVRVFRFLYLFLGSFIYQVKHLHNYPELIILFILLLIVIFKTLSNNQLLFRVPKRLFVIGIIIFFAGAFPYLLVNKIPHFGGYNSRHMLLLGFGLAPILGFITFYPKSVLWKKGLVSISLSLFVVVNISLQFNYFKGYMKHEVFKDALASYDFSNGESRTVLVEDNTLDFTTKGNPSQFHALTGLLKQVEPGENTLLIREKEFNELKESNLLTYLEPYFHNYSLTNYTITEPTHELVVNYTEVELPTFPLIQYYENFITGNKEEWNKYFDFQLKKLNN